MGTMFLTLTRILDLSPKSQTTLAPRTGPFHTSESQSIKWKVEYPAHQVSEAAKKQKGGKKEIENLPLNLRVLYEFAFSCLYGKPQLINSYKH